MTLQLLLPIIVVSFLLISIIIINRPQRVLVADAGPTRELNRWEQLTKNFFTPYGSSVLANGKSFRSKDYIRVFVDGRCMEPRGIKDKSQVLVKPIKKGLAFKSQVKLEDVLLIYLHDKKVFKLRILQNDDDLNQLVTYRYENGEKHRSSRNHRVNDVIGIVKYIIN